MSIISKILLYLLITVVVIVGGFLAFFHIKFPSVSPPEDIKVEITPARIERGSYLFNHVSMCGECHTTRDWTKFTAPIKEELLGSGNFDEFIEELGFPGNYYASNITPFNLGDWTDGEIFRTITSGVNKHGRALFPVMPYLNYGKMDREDIYSIIAYLRTLPSIERETPESKPKFPLNFINKTIPRDPTFSQIPPKTNSVKYGEYLVNAAACFDCHTKAEKGTPLPGMEYAGGFEFKLPTGGTVRSANITPDKSTGIGSWTKEQFIMRFKVYADSNYTFPSVNKGEFNTYMPWKNYAGMTETDLGAIYDYLMSVKPVNNKVVRFEN